MTPTQQHRYIVCRQGDGRDFLAFELSSGQPSSYSNSLFTLDLREWTTHAEAEALAVHINRHLRGVSSTSNATRPPRGPCAEPIGRRPVGRIATSGGRSFLSRSLRRRGGDIHFPTDADVRHGAVILN